MSKPIEAWAIKGPGGRILKHTRSTTARGAWLKLWDRDWSSTFLFSCQQLMRCKKEEGYKAVTITEIEEPESR